MLALSLPFNVGCSCAVQLSTLPLLLRFTNVEVRPWDGYLRWIGNSRCLQFNLLPSPAKVSIPCSYLDIESEAEGAGTINIEWEG